MRYADDIVILCQTDGEAIMALVTRRTNGKSMQETVCEVSSILRGWYEYYKHSRLQPLKKVDVWVRVRLRSILRKRNGGRGRGRGYDHFKWPNEYFKELGLFSMIEARNLLVQSSCR